MTLPEWLAIVLDLDAYITKGARFRSDTRSLPRVASAPQNLIDRTRVLEM
jgi:hypothetical protein